MTSVLYPIIVIYASPETNYLVIKVLPTAHCKHLFLSQYSDFNWSNACECNDDFDTFFNPLYAFTMELLSETIALDIFKMSSSRS